MFSFQEATLLDYYANHSYGSHSMMVSAALMLGEQAARSMRTKWMEAHA
jgi:hypothetical protein